MRHPGPREAQVHEDARRRQRLRRARRHLRSGVELDAATAAAPRRPALRRRLRPDPAWSSGRARPASISAIASSTPTAARSSSAATARAASCASCATGDSPRSARSASRRSSGVIAPRLEDDGQRHGGHGRAVVRARPRPVRHDRARSVARSPAGSPLAAGARKLAIWPLDVYGRTAHVIVVSMGNPHARAGGARRRRRAGRDAGAAHRAASALPAAGERRLHAGGRPARASRCACTSAARARRSPAAPARARRWSPASGAGCSTRRCAVATRGGELTIAWAGADNPVYMTGPAETVFEGEIEIERAEG